MYIQDPSLAGVDEVGLFFLLPLIPLAAAAAKGAAKGAGKGKRKGRKQSARAGRKDKKVDIKAAKQGLVPAASTPPTPVPAAVKASGVVIGCMRRQTAYPYGDPEMGEGASGYVTIGNVRGR